MLTGSLQRSPNCLKLLSSKLSDGLRGGDVQYIEKSFRVWLCSTSKQRVHKVRDALFKEGENGFLLSFSAVNNRKEEQWDTHRHTHTPLAWPVCMQWVSP